MGDKEEYSEINKYSSKVKSDNSTIKQISEISLSSSHTTPVVSNYMIKDETGIEEIFDLVHSKTKVPKTSINKLKTAFKKHGFNTAKILRLKKNKQNDWNFLYENFKDVCSQVEGVSLFLENLLEQTI